MGTTTSGGLTAVLFGMSSCSKKSKISLKPSGLTVPARDCQQSRTRSLFLIARAASNMTKNCDAGIRREYSTVQP